MKTENNVINAIRFYFKVNNSKFDNPIKLQNQIELVVNKLIKAHNIKSKSIELKFGTVDDDIIYNRCMLLISFNLL